MATLNYTQFKNLIKISGTVESKYSTYQEQIASDSGSGKLIFAEFTAPDDATDADKEKAGKYIYANGIEYRITDSTNYEDLVKRVEACEEWESALEFELTQDAETKVVELHLNGIESSVLVKGGDFVDVAVDASTITIGLAEASIAKGTADGALNDKLVTKDYVDEKVGGAVSDVSVVTTIDDNVATVNIAGVDSDEEKIGDGYNVKLSGSDSITITASDDDETLVNIDVKVADSSTLIDDATATDTSIATAYAVKTYVEDKLGDIANALTFEGGAAELTAIIEKTSGVEDSAVGSMYVNDGTESLSVLDKVVEPGDNVIVTKVEGGKVAEVTVVERNLDGAVTSGDILTVGHVVIGNDGQSVNDSGYTLGADSSAAYNNTLSEMDASVLATQKGVKEYVDAMISDVTIDADSSTALYIDASFIESDKKVQVGAKVMKLEDIQNDTSTGLADALDVSLAIKSAQRTIGVSTTDGVENSADINLLNGETVACHIVATTTTTDYININVVDATDTTSGTINIDASVLALKDCYDADADGGEGLDSLTDGLASAKDVYSALIEVEETVAAAHDAMATTIGLEADYSIKWTDGSGIEEGTTVKKAIEDLYASNASRTYVNEELTEVSGTVINDEFVAISANADEDGTVTLDSSILVTDAVARLDGLQSTTATAVATDAFVTDSIANALVWFEL